jgi:hypothetical protein
VIEWGNGGTDEPDAPADEVSDAPAPPEKTTLQFSEEEILVSRRDAEHPPSDDAPEKSAVWSATDDLLQPVNRPPQEEEPEHDLLDEDAYRDEDTRVHETTPVTPDLTGSQQENAPVMQDEEDLSRTPDMPFAFHVRDAVSASGIPRIPMVSGTLPKEWQQMGRLSAQLSINPVNLVAGERVRVPVSLRNGYDHPVQLRIHVAGLPKEQVILPPQPLYLGPGEVSAFDLVLQTQILADSPRQELMIRLRDPDAPDVALTASLNLVFKNAPDITGWLDPIEVQDNRPLYLYLQNHTKATAQVSVAGHAGVRGLHVVPAHTQFPIAPGQVVKVPVQLDAPRRKWLRATRHAFSLSAQQGNRAPLDFPGDVHVRPRIPVIPAALAVLALLVIAVVAIVLLSSRENGTPATRVEVVTATPSAAQADDSTGQPLLAPGSDSASATPTPTPSPRPSDTATPTATATEALVGDPRQPGCTVPIPEGWFPYTVQDGDRVYRLAFDRGTTTDEVAAVNCLDNPRLLHVGDILLLPGP